MTEGDQENQPNSRQTGPASGPTDSKAHADAEPQETETGQEGAGTTRPRGWIFLVATAALLLVAGIIHILAAAAHADHAIGHGIAFASMGVAQILIAVFLYHRPDRLSMLLAAAATGGLFLLWVFTLVGPTPFGEESLDGYAIGTKLAELAGFATLILFALANRQTDPEDRQERDRGAATAGVAILALIIAMLLSGVAMYAGGLAATPLFPDDWVHHPHDHGHNGDGHGHGHNGHNGDGHGGHGFSIHFTADVQEGEAPLAVAFTAHVSGLDGHGVRWSFDAGDGTVQEGDKDSFEETWEHVYEQEGNFTAVFRLEGDHDHEQESIDIAVFEIPEPEPMQATWEFDASAGCLGLDLCVSHTTGEDGIDGYTFELDDPRYAGLDFTAESDGAGTTWVAFFDGGGEFVGEVRERGKIPTDATQAFIYSGLAAVGHTFDVTLPEGVPEA